MAIVKKETNSKQEVKRTDMAVKYIDEEKFVQLLASALSKTQIQDPRVDGIISALGKVETILNGGDKPENGLAFRAISAEKLAMDNRAKT